MHIQDVDLNLLQLFAAVYRAGNVSRAAQALGLTQPAASQGLSRLRALIHDPLFVRAPGGVRPTPRATRLSGAVLAALAQLENALNDTQHFDPQTAQMTVRLHLSDIGEARFLPELVAALRQQAPGVRVESAPSPHAEIPGLLDSGQLTLAIGFLPAVRGTRHHALVKDHYAVMLRRGHPWLASKQAPSLRRLRQLDYAAVRSHSETLHILQLLQLEDRLRLTTAHFLALPDILRQTDLAVLVPRNIARGFDRVGELALVEPKLLPLSDFTVSLHWSERFENDAANRWLRQLVISLFAGKSGKPSRDG